MSEKIRRALIERDHGCVFCYLGYRKEEHIPIAEYDYHMRRGKMYSCCEYHAQFLRSAWPGFLIRRKEMNAILDEYLKDKEDPKPF